jgi:hypothetical protein
MVLAWIALIEKPPVVSAANKMKNSEKIILVVLHALLDHTTMI